MTKKGSAVWKGSLKEGGGTISTETGVLKEAPYGFKARFENGPGTNPEELIGAAHAGCFSMAFSLILGNAGLTNTITGLVLIHTVQGLSFTTLFCRNYFVNIPDDLIKAARIDGAGFWRIFRRIVLPLSPPIVIVTVIWQFTGIWNDFIYGVIFSSGDKQPITSALIALTAGATSVRYHNVEAAAVLMAAVPPLLVYLFGGKYFVRGLTQGAVK